MESLVFNLFLFVLGISLLREKLIYYKACSVTHDNFFTDKT